MSDCVQSEQSVLCILCIDERKINSPLRGMSVVPDSVNLVCRGYKIGIVEMEALTR